ncbi:MAG: hypothetical protein R3C97_00875 [Geminicoccaceae bacterium]
MTSESIAQKSVWPGPNPGCNPQTDTDCFPDDFTIDYSGKVNRNGDVVSNSRQIKAEMRDYLDKKKIPKVKRREIMNKLNATLADLDRSTAAKEKPKKEISCSGGGTGLGSGSGGATVNCGFKISW